MTGPPRRLLEDPSAPGALRADLERARIAPARPYNAEGGLARFRGAVTGAGTASGGDTGGAAGTLASTGKSAALGYLKWALVPAGAAAIAVAGAMIARAPVPNSGHGEQTVAPGRPGGHDDAAFSLSISELAPEQVAAGPASGPAASEPAVQESRPASAVAEPVLDRKNVPREPSQGRSARRGPVVDLAPALPADPDARLRLEIEALAEARRALAADPARALALAEQGQQQFRDGMFGQEREAIGIFALHKLGQEARARQRAEAFLARYPDGPFSEQVRRLLKIRPTR